MDPSQSFDAAPQRCPHSDTQHIVLARLAVTLQAHLNVGQGPPLGKSFTAPSPKAASVLSYTGPDEVAVRQQQGMPRAQRARSSAVVPEVVRPPRERRDHLNGG